jgi:hypothetical protein
MAGEEWIDVGSAEELKATPVQSVVVGRHKLALTCKASSAIPACATTPARPLARGTLTASSSRFRHYYKSPDRRGRPG